MKVTRTGSGDIAIHFTSQCTNVVALEDQNSLFYLRLFDVKKIIAEAQALSQHLSVHAYSFN